MPVSNTEILTRDGWKRYENVQVGDETVGYNPETGRSEWTTVTHVNVYGNAPLVRLRNKTWEAECTPNHRWVTSHVRQADNRKMINGVREPAPSTSYRVDEFTAASQLTSRHSIRLAAPSDTGESLPISAGEAELLGWVMGDGGVSRYKSRTPGSTHWRTGTGSMTRIRLYQAKSAGVAAIDALLAAEGVLSSRHTYPAAGIARQPPVTWTLRASYTAELLKRSGYDHDDPVPFVLSLSEPQREAFLRGVFGAEGHQGAPGMAFGRGPYAGTKTYSQADGPQQDAIVLALYLSGHRPSIHNWSAASRAGLGSRTGANVGETKPFVSGARTRYEDAGRADVWCPTTELGSWTARQGRHVFLTGNSVYGNPVNAAAHELAFNWYSRGGLVPGYASGGLVGQQGAAWLQAWRTRHGGGFGAAHGPVVVNEQIARMAAAAARARTLAGARGLSPGQHRFWAAAAADETRRLGVLHKELGVERAWRNQLAGSDAVLGAEIAAAGTLPSLRKNAAAWKAQIGRQKATIGQISGMLGYSAAHQAAFARAHPAAAATGVQATHTYGGDIVNSIAPVLAAALAPFTGAARGGLVMDGGGWLRPGWNPPSFNGTGRPEHLVPARGSGAGTIRLEVTSGGSTEFDRFMTAWLRKHVHVRGGGSAQRAFGTH